MTSKEFVFSLSDLWSVCKKRRSKILTFGLIVGLLFFAYQLKKPLLYTASGIFKGGNPQPPPLSKALELLGGGESYATAEDPKSFLRSYPVLEEVVQTLNLQVTVLDQRQSIGRISALFRTLKTEWAHLRMKKPKVSSRILANGVPLLTRPLFDEPVSPLQCLHVIFSKEMAQVLSIHFEKEDSFKVFDGKHLLGEGKLGRFFMWEGGSFILEGQGAKKCALHFIPLEQAVKSLEKSLQVKRDKENGSLIHLSYTHSDRCLAKNVVNQTMLSFQSFLKKEGGKKIAQQLDYLEVRQRQVQEGLEKMMDAQCASLQEHLDEGALITLEKELEFLAHNQAKERNYLHQTAAEIQSIHQAITGENIDLQGVIGWTKMLKLENKEAFSSESARLMLSDYQCQLDNVYLDVGRFDFCQAKLAEPQFDGSSLSKLLSDPSLTTRFEKMHTLHRNLADAHNFSEKEKSQLKEALESEKQFLIKHIEHLKEGAFIQEKVLKRRLFSLQQTLLSLLVVQYEAIEGRLQTLSHEAAHLPKKWLAERKIDITLHLYSEMVESITKMIEAKNIGYHLEYLSASPLKMAPSCVLPDPPRLLRSFFIGIILGVLFTLGLYLLHEMWKGPSASYENLLSYGYKFMGYFSTSSKQRDLQTIRKTAHSISNEGVILVGSQILSEFPSALCSLLAKQGEKVLLFNLSDVPCGANGSFECRSLEHPLGSKQFKALLFSLKNDFDKICLLLQASPESVEMAEILPFAETTIFCITNERLKDFASFETTNTLFLIQETPSSFPLSHIIPLLETIRKRLIPSSFSLASKKTS